MQGHALHAADHDAAQLTGIDLALNARHRLNDRFVIAKLTAGNLLLKRLHIPADAPIRCRQINAALSKAPGQLDRAEGWKPAQLIDQVISVPVEQLGPRRAFLQTAVETRMRDQLLHHHPLGNLAGLPLDQTG